MLQIKKKRATATMGMDNWRVGGWEGWDSGVMGGALCEGLEGVRDR